MSTKERESGRREVRERQRLSERSGGWRERELQRDVCGREHTGSSCKGFFWRLILIRPDLKCTPQSPADS